MSSSSVNTLSMEYASTIFNLAKENNEVEEVESNLNVLVNVLKENNEFSSLLLHPAITLEEKKQILKKSLSLEDGYFLYFLYVLIDNSRFDQLEAISCAYHELVLESENLMVAEVYTKFKLDKEQLVKLQEKLQKEFKHKVMINEHLDETMLAGIKVVAKGKSYDYSIDTQMDELKEKIMRG